MHGVRTEVNAFKFYATRQFAEIESMQVDFTVVSALRFIIPEHSE